jgi:hypothetical protein
VSHIVAAPSGQHIGLAAITKSLRCRPRILWVHQVTVTRPPLSEKSGVVTLRLGEGADPVREAQRVGEVWEMEDALAPSDPITLKRSCQSGTSCLAQRSPPRSRAASRDGRPHTVRETGCSWQSPRLPGDNDLGEAEQIISKPPACDQSTKPGCPCAASSALGNREANDDRSPGPLIGCHHPGSQDGVQRNGVRSERVLPHCR